MIKVFLQLIGWMLAHTPEPILSSVCVVLGRLMLWLSRRRRRIIFSNLSHAFPNRSDAWRKKIAHASCTRLFETALLSLASPFLSENRLQTIVHVSPEFNAFYGGHHALNFAMITAVPHMAYWESLTWMRLFLSTPLPEFGVIFRPLNNSALDTWIRATRERFGMRLLSRKTGMQEAFRMLKRRSVVGILFDQNAGMQGALTLLYQRVCSTTELPGLLGEKTEARITVHYPRRLGFWRMRFEIALPSTDGTAASTTLALNRWLEQAMESDDNLCSSWLWSHDRWRNQDFPDRRFRLEAKRNLLNDDLAARGLTAMPKKTRIWIRMPNWLGDVVMALPLIRALRVSRPDAEITLIAKSSFAPLLTACDFADHFEPLPLRGFGYFRHFWRKRRGYPDVYVLLTHSVRSDLEAWLTRCPQRFGVVRAGKKRPLLTHAYSSPGDFLESDHHQLELWENFFRRFGLESPLDLSPLALTTPSPVSSLVLPKTLIGLIAGSENSPEKRWPVERWRGLISALSQEFPYISFSLFGTANDRTIAAAIADGFGARVENMTGKTTLSAYMDQLRQCSVLVSNDTGGMHLANALGVPVVALFGPTNPVRTGPIYSTPHTVLQPPGCPARGGTEIAQLYPEAVTAAIRALLPTRVARE